MITEPKGVMQNHAPPHHKPDLRPVSRENWKMFASLADARKGLDMIRTVVTDAEMKDATEGQYSQFIYEEKHPDVRVRLVEGRVGLLAVLEFPSDIFDRSIMPQFFVDKYQMGESGVLRCMAISDEIGQLYWDKNQ